MTAATRIVRVQVPATSANLGPGYDCVGLALALFDTLEAAVDPAGGLVIEVAGEGAESVPRDSSHLVIKALGRGLAEAQQEVPGLRLTCVNRIPHGRGLGSSSAAIAGGLALARGLLPDGSDVLTNSRLIEIATELEGHPDNVAPAILGGLTLAWMDGGAGKAIQLPAHADLQPVVAIPSTPLATERARALLPATVPHRDAARNAGRAALLVEALTRRPDLLLAATEDRLHQEYRRFAYPASYALMATLRQSGIPAMISGAGPTVIALGLRGSGATGSDVRNAMNDAIVAAGAGQPEFAVQPLAVEAGGIATELI